MDAISSSFNDFFEDSAREALPVVLYKCFGLSIQVPATRGVNPKFRRADADCSSWWPSTLPDEVEMDFVGHTTQQFPEQSAGDTVGHHLTVVSVSNNKKPPKTYAPLPVSPVEKVQALPLPISPEVPSTAITTEDSKKSQYLFAEITNGGIDSVKAKVTQLEKNCTLVLAKHGVQQGDVLEVVNCAIVVNGEARSTDLFNFIDSNRERFPCVYALFIHGRFLYAQHKERVIDVIKSIQGRQEDLQAEVTDLRSDVHESKELLTAICNHLSVSHPTLTILTSADPSIATPADASAPASTATAIDVDDIAAEMRSVGVAHLSDMLKAAFVGPKAAFALANCGFLEDQPIDIFLTSYMEVVAEAAGKKCNVVSTTYRVCKGDSAAINVYIEKIIRSVRKKGTSSSAL